MRYEEAKRRSATLSRTSLVEFPRDVPLTKTPVATRFPSHRRGPVVVVVDSQCAHAAGSRRANGERAAKERGIQIETRRGTMYPLNFIFLYVSPLHPIDSAIFSRALCISRKINNKKDNAFFRIVRMHLSHFKYEKT